MDEKPPLNEMAGIVNSLFFRNEGYAKEWYRLELLKRLEPLWQELLRLRSHSDIPTTTGVNKGSTKLEETKDE